GCPVSSHDMDMRRDTLCADGSSAASIEIAQTISKSPTKRSSSQSTQRKTARKQPQPTKANLAQIPQVASAEAFTNEALRKVAYYADDNVLIFNMDVRQAMDHLAAAGVFVNCMVTSPPFYGQRDYGVDGQIGLEEHPREFIDQL